MIRLNPAFDPRDLGQIVLIQPHLDDAVLSCGALLAGLRRVKVVALFAGVPEPASVSTEWDRKCGFTSAAEAVAARRAEDRTAMAMLGAEVIHLDFLDGQYRETAPDSMVRLSAAIAKLVIDSSADTVIVPLGLHHADHLRARCAWLTGEASLFEQKPVHAERIRWIAYADVPYRQVGASLQDAMGDLAVQGWGAAPARWAEASCEPDQERGKRRVAPSGHAMKQQALQAYPSQLSALGEDSLMDASAPESFWRLTPPARRAPVSPLQVPGPGAESESESARDYSTLFEGDSNSCPILK